jgi:hypothetical protein
VTGVISLAATEKGTAVDSERHMQLANRDSIINSVKIWRLTSTFYTITDQLSVKLGMKIMPLGDD